MGQGLTLLEQILKSEVGYRVTTLFFLLQNYRIHAVLHVGSEVVFCVVVADSNAGVEVAIGSGAGFFTDFLLFISRYVHRHFIYFKDFALYFCITAVYL